MNEKAVASPNGARTDRHWWENQWLLLALVLLAGVPLLYPQVPPLIDLPGHIGRYYVQLNLAHDPFLQQHYDFRWRLVGNLGIDALVALFAPWFGLEPTVKCIVLLIPMLSVAAMLAIVRVAHGRVPPTAFFALPYAYSIFFQFGFVNCILGQALALLAFAFWYWLTRRGYALAAIAFLVPASVLIWLCHMLGWLTLCLLVFGAQIAHVRAQREHWPRIIFLALMRCVPMAIPLAITLYSSLGDGHNDPPAGWFNWTNKLGTLATALQDRWQWFDVLTFIIVVQVIAQGVFNPDHKRHAALQWGAMMCALALIGLPYIAAGGVYLDVRLCWIVMVMAVLMIDFNISKHPRTANALAALGIALFAVRMAAQSASYVLLENAWRHELSALDSMPRASRVAALVPVGCAGPMWQERYNHLASLGLLHKGLLVNDRFTGGIQMLMLKNPIAPDFEQDPAQLVEDERCPHPVYPDVKTQLARLPRNAFDYIWVIGMDEPFLPPPDSQIVWHQGRSMVLRIDHAYVR